MKTGSKSSNITKLTEIQYISGDIMYICIKLRPIYIAAAAVLAAGLAALPFVTFPDGREIIPASAVPEQPSTEFTVLMYHSLADSPKRAGEYVFLPEDFELDMKYLHDSGYNTVSAAEVYGYACGKNALPENPVMITFDDGFLNVLTYALPVLEKYDMCAVMNIVGSYSEKSEEYNDHSPAYAYLTPEEICELENSGRFEIGSHTYAMHSLDRRRGCSKISWESESDYYTAFSADCIENRRFLADRCGIDTNIFAYPYGYISEGSSTILGENGYNILFTCYERPNNISFGEISEGDTLFIDRYNRPWGRSPEDFLGSILP